MLINLELPQPPTFHTLQILRKKKKKFNSQFSCIYKYTHSSYSSEESREFFHSPNILTIERRHGKLI